MLSKPIDYLPEARDHRALENVSAEVTLSTFVSVLLLCQARSETNQQDRVPLPKDMQSKNKRQTNNIPTCQFPIYAPNPKTRPTGYEGVWKHSISLIVTIPQPGKSLEEVRSREMIKKVRKGGLAHKCGNLSVSP